MLGLRGVSDAVILSDTEISCTILQELGGAWMSLWNWMDFPMYLPECFFSYAVLKYAQNAMYSDNFLVIGRAIIG
jgi:hypothetical protein